MKRLLILIPLSLLVRLTAAVSDAPYVVLEPDRMWSARTVVDADAKTVKEKQVAPGSTITIPAVGTVPAFTVEIRETPATDPDTVALPSDTPLFIVADTHGEFEILAMLLQKQGIIDAHLKWAFGKGHLVFLGDAFDRGPNQTEIFWLIYELERQAAAAGGAVHFLLGNHEVMTLTGDLRYENQKYLRVADALHVARYSELWDERSLLGRWLRTKPAVLKIGAYLCLHGGISRALLDARLPLTQINANVRDSLTHATIHPADPATTKLVTGKLGPLWYRGYFPDQKDFPTAKQDDIQAILTGFDARAVFVGHTIVEHVTPLYEGKVFAVQVYPHRDEKTGAPVMEAVKIEHGKISRAEIDGSLTPLP